MDLQYQIEKYKSDCVFNLSNHEDAKKVANNFMDHKVMFTLLSNDFSNIFIVFNKDEVPKHWHDAVIKEVIGELLGYEHDADYLN